MAQVLQLLGPSTGGIRRHVDVLARHLPTQGWDVEVAGPGGVMDGLATAATAVDVTNQPIRALRAARSVRSLSRGADLVHAHGLTAGWTAIAARTHKPVVVTVHNVVLDEAAGRSAPLLRRLESWLPGRVDQVIAVSPQIADHLGRGDHTTVIVPASEPPVPITSSDDIRTDLGLEPAAPLVVTVARLHPQKAIDDLLEATAIAREQIGGLHLAVVGDGPERATLQARAEDLGLTDAVTFTGQQTDAAGWMAAADVVAVSSIWEGSPLVVAEALRLGRPLVSTDVGDVSEVVIDGRTGRLVHPSSPRRLAEALLDLLSDPERAAAMGAAGKALAEDRYGIDSLVSAVADVYRLAVSRRSTGTEEER